MSWMKFFVIIEAKCFFTSFNYITEGDSHLTSNELEGLRSLTVGDMTINKVYL